MIVIYTHPDCPYSMAAKDDLVQRDVPYTERDVSKDQAAAEELELLTGGDRTTPVIVDGTLVTVGYMGVG